LRIAHRLVTGRGRINDGESRIAEYDSAVLKYSPIIWPTMPLRSVHPNNSIS